MGFGNFIIKRDEDGNYHCEDGPAVIGPNGYFTYFIHGTMHRDCGPAHYNSETETKYVIDGNYHRLDGPARTFVYEREHEWWMNGINVTNRIKLWASEMNIDLENLTEEDKILIQIKWENYGK